MEEQYYLQDKRQYVGNDLLWWAKDCNGYTCHIEEAHVFSKEEAFEQNKRRHTDVPWPKDYIDERIVAVVDAQRVSIVDAIPNAGAVLHQPAPPAKVPSFRCSYCGKFISTYGYQGICPHCDGDNRP